MDVKSDGYLFLKIVRTFETEVVLQGCWEKSSSLGFGNV